MAIIENGTIQIEEEEEEEEGLNRQINTKTWETNILVSQEKTADFVIISSSKTFAKW